LGEPGDTQRGVRQQSRAAVSVASFGGPAASTLNGDSTATAFAVDSARNPSLKFTRGTGIASTGSAASTSAEAMVPAPPPHYVTNHRGQFVDSTVSFNLAPGFWLSDVVASGPTRS
jgi:hypothetical protein